MEAYYDISVLRDYEARGLITGRDHPELPLTVWNYTAKTQYENLWDYVTTSTRGVVTNHVGTVVSPCIPKFFNLSQTEHSIGSFKHAQQKLDGSLIHIFYYEGQWICSSRGSFASDQAKWAQALVDDLPDYFNSTPSAKGSTYVCELIHPDNRIVLDYGVEYSLRLITAFTLDFKEDSWSEYEAEWVTDWPWEVAQRYTLEEVPAIMKLTGIEGVVLIDDHGFRVKIKTEEYVELHRIVTGLTTKSVLEYIIENGSVSGLAESVPDEWYQRMQELEQSFKVSVFVRYRYVESVYNLVIEGITDNFTRRQFAEAVSVLDNRGLYFSMLDERPIMASIEKNIFDDRDQLGLEL
jgi:RNA ligase